MPKSVDEVRRTLTNMIEAIGQPDLGTEDGRTDYRVLLLTQNALALLDLEHLNPDAAVFLFHVACERLRELGLMKLLDMAQAKSLVGEMVALYAKFRPELLPRLLTDPEKAKELFPDE